MHNGSPKRTSPSTCRRSWHRKVCWEKKTRRLNGSGSSLPNLRTSTPVRRNATARAVPSSWKTFPSSAPGKSTSTPCSWAWTGNWKGRTATFPRNTKWKAWPEFPARRDMRTTCSGAGTANPLPWWKPKKPARTPIPEERRPNSMPTVLSSVSGNAPSCSRPTASIPFSGMTKAVPSAR